MQNTSKKVNQPSQTILRSKENESIPLNKQQIFSCITNRDCVILLIVFLLTITVLSSILGYSIYVNLSRANDRLQKIELKFHKFLFYVKYIYKNEKNQEIEKEEQTNSIASFLSKISKGYEQKKEEVVEVQTKHEVGNMTNVEGQGVNKVVTSDEKQSGKKNQVELLSGQEMIDIAMKIIEEEQNQQPYTAEHPQQQPTVNVTPVEEVAVPSNVQPPALSKKVDALTCQVDYENAFRRNFEYDPHTQRLRKSKYTSSFQSVICEQPIPKHGVYELPVKILRTQKSFIYIGIAGGEKKKVYNITSLHENANFYGYSGYSGRIWQATKRKVAYEMFQANTIFKLKVDMDLKLMEYYFNEVKVGESQIGGLCQKQCWFVIELYNDGDEVEFLQTLNLDAIDVPDANSIEL